MAWTTKVLKVYQEGRNKNGELKSKYECVRMEDEGGKHFDPQFQKVSYYKKDGAETRGYAQPLNKYDFKWIDANRAQIDADLASDWKATAPESSEDVPY
jgi:hypothetical protein